MPLLSLQSAFTLSICWGNTCGGETATFLIKGPKIIPLEKLSSTASPLRTYLFAVVFLLPGVIIGSTLRITSLILSPTFREHYKALVTYSIPQAIYPIPPPDDPWKDPLTWAATYFSCKDLTHLAQVNKAWYWRAKSIFLEKIGLCLGKYNPDLTPRAIA